MWLHRTPAGFVAAEPSQLPPQPQVRHHRLPRWRLSPLQRLPPAGCPGQSWHASAALPPAGKHAAWCEVAVGSQCVEQELNGKVVPKAAAAEFLHACPALAPAQTSAAICRGSRRMQAVPPGRGLAARISANVASWVAHPPCPAALVQQNEHFTQRAKQTLVVPSVNLLR